jgi:L-alanine-DL-glutamate epimerase-like enolase superfamily enzyme
MKRNTIATLILGIIFLAGCTNQPKKQVEEETQVTSTRWTEAQAKAWGDENGWLRGSNFNPSTAINQLETWQAESFDPETIDRELGWAEDIGMNCMRVYLHHVAWQVDKEGFKHRMNQYLTIADSHGIKTIFVFFDDCWNPTYQAGKQPDPKPGVHNSGWVRDPGELIYEKPELITVLEEYVKDVLSTFKNDKRIVMWDLYNEPGNNNYGNKSMPLLEKVFAWGWEVRPTQPMSVGVWNASLTDLNVFQLANSDITTYHNYSGPDEHQSVIDSLRKYNRPLVCTEYMARRNNSLFQNIMPILKQENVGAINWGLVDGKSNTKYAWDEPIADGSEPALWFHEIFHKDGTPYKQEEVDLIKSLTGAEKENSLLKSNNLKSQNMKRRNFIQTISGGTAAAYLVANPLLSASMDSISNSSELQYHTIEKMEMKKVRINYPRFVSKNAIRGNHGWGYDEGICELTTDKGAMGWGVLLWGQSEKDAAEYVVGKKVSDLFAPEIGLIDPKAALCDLALHDLAGKIMNKPVYELMGATKPEIAVCYSGMIYFDDLTPFYNKAAGVDIILKECQFDYDLGYRQFKLKIGRGNKWMPKAAGIQRDIEVTKLVAKAFPACDILVDGNDGYPLEDFEIYLKGIEGVKLFWIEEPFRETIEDYTKLRTLLKNMGMKTLLADGEASPDQKFLRQLEEQKLIDVHLTDIQDIGFTGWRKIMPELKKMGILASPHAWGSQIKTNNVAHLTAAYGNTVTIEGVTCISDDFDLGNYRLEGGKLIPSSEPGFGMTLLK